MCYISNIIIKVEALYLKDDMSRVRIGAVLLKPKQGLDSDLEPIAYMHWRQSEAGEWCTNINKEITWCMVSKDSSIEFLEGRWNLNQS